MFSLLTVAFCCMIILFTFLVVVGGFTVYDVDVPYCINLFMEAKGYF